MASYNITLSLDYITICPDDCSGTIIYNNGVSPSGVTKAERIIAGSSAGTGGQGIVSNLNYTSTEYVAATEIFLLPEFQATVTSSRVFSATINPCNPETKVFLETSNSQKTIASTFERNENRGKIISENDLIIYPNPSTGKITINFYSFNNGLVEIRIINSVGVVLKKLMKAVVNKNSLQQVEVDLKNLPKGQYYNQE
jgi:hypothetical protein